MADESAPPAGDQPPEGPDPWAPLPSRKALRGLGDLFRQTERGAPEPEPEPPVDDDRS